MPKDAKAKLPTISSSTYNDSEMMFATPRLVSLKLILDGDAPGPGDWPFLVFFNGQIVLEGKWHDELVLESEALALNLMDIYYQQLVASLPLIFILRTFGSKGIKDTDPFLNLDNRAAATVDLFPLVLGEEDVNVRMPLIMINSGESTNCVVNCFAKAKRVSDNNIRIPLMVTMISAHCLPHVKEGTVYIAALGLTSIIDRPAVNFGMSLSTTNASKIVWASACNGGEAANTTFNLPNEDIFIPDDFEPKDTENCNSVYWNAMKRVLVDSISLRDRLSTPFLIEIAGIPRTGKIEVRGRYMGFVDAGVLLEPGQYGVTTCAKLQFYNESDLPEYDRPLLELPPTSAKISARETNLTTDEFGHNAYIKIRFDLFEPLVPKTKLSQLYETMGFAPSEGHAVAIDALEIDPPHEDPMIDVRRIRKECGALAVHRELSELACRGAVPMNQGIKRTAANRLLMRVRTMLKQFTPGECSLIDWQETVTAQHAASRRAVTASFAPQPPVLRSTPKVAAARCRLAGDNRLADMHLRNNLSILGKHPRPLLSKVLRLLEQGKQMDARNYLLQALGVHTQNKFLLWTFGAQEFDKGYDGFDSASSSFRVAIKGDSSEGTSNAIGWAALHAINHYYGNHYAAFVAAKKMRKSHELSTEWKLFYNRWTDISGEEEIYWAPTAISCNDPILVAAAFFLCLRCYSFTEILLKCYENQCSTKGSRFKVRAKIGPDLFYLKAAMCLLKQELDIALNLTNEGTKQFGPSPIMSQMRATCLACMRGWDGDCEAALIEAEKAGADTCPSLVLKAALSGMNIDPHAALQRAARVHKIAPSAHSALTIGRIYKILGEENLAERWGTAAVKLEPMLADGWAFLALFAMYQRDIHKARTMLRTAKQAGSLSPEIDEEVQHLKEIIQVETLPDALVKNLCFCDYY